MNFFSNIRVEKFRRTVGFEVETELGAVAVSWGISGSVAPLARFIIAITSAFLLLPSTLGLAAGFLARAGFFADLVFFAGACRCVCVVRLDAHSISP